MATAAHTGWLSLKTNHAQLPPDWDGDLAPEPGVRPAESGRGALPHKACRRVASGPMAAHEFPTIEYAMKVTAAEAVVHPRAADEKVCDL